MYFTYILLCHDGTYYVGQTTNVEKRIKQHNGILKGGAKYTSGRRPVQLHYVEKCISHKEACKKEAYFKKLSHNKKSQLTV
jgi:putative endonuclease